MLSPNILISLAPWLALATAKSCTNATVPVTISARNGVFNLSPPSSSLEATAFTANMTRQGGNFTAEALTGYNTVSGSYNISTQYCVPDNSRNSSSIVQVLTHGIGFDKTYWDLSFNNYNYSYVKFATRNGYSTLSYDRLGIGNSSHGEAVNEIQASLEVAALATLTEMLRNGSFPGAPAAQKVVHIGHSFGSAQSYTLSSLYPNLSDAVVLTGFSMNASFVNLFMSGANFQLASVNQPLRFSNQTIPSLINALSAAVQDLIAPYQFPSFSDINSALATLESMVPNITSYTQEALAELPPSQNLPSGYLVSSNAEANKYLFLQNGAFDPKILDLAERTKQPVTIGELLSLGSAPMMSAFAGPVLVLTGATDLPYCGGNCSTMATPNANTSIPAGVQKAFPKVAASNFSAVVLPNIAHGINLHYNATGAYQEIQNFLNAKGLGARNSTA